MKQLNPILTRILFTAVLLAAAATPARAAVLFDQRPVLFSGDTTTFQRGINWQSKGGVPLSSTVGNPVGSNGRAPADNTPTLRQFSGGIVYGAVTYQKSTTLVAGSLPANARREHLNWPRIENADGTIRLVLRAQSGAPYMMRSIAFFFGSVIAAPEVNESGSPLSAVNRLTYWAAEPHTTDNHVSAGYYWSPHAQRVYATQPGRVDLVWRRRSGVSLADKISGVNYVNIGGLHYALLTTNYLVSGATVKTPRKIYWTEGRFRDTGKPVSVPTARVGDVKIVYNNTFPEFVGKENAVFVEGDEPYITNRTDRTLWYDASATKQILARNKEGRVFVEVLGDIRGAGPFRNQLGFEIVDVIRQPTPADVTIELGELLTPPGQPAVELFPEPLLSTIGKNFAFQRSVPGSDRIELYATRETRNLNDYQVFWMEESVAGLRWPSILARYSLIWPASPAKYSHYVRQEADQNREEAKKTAVVLPTDNVPVLEYQDLDPQGNTRAALTADFKFFSFLDETIPAHRSLLRLSAGDNIAFERVLSLLDRSVKAPGFDGSRERAINARHFSGAGVSPALDLSPAQGNAHGQLPAGTYFDGGSFTIEAWVNVRSHQNEARLIDFGDSTLADNVAVILSAGTTGKPRLVIKNSGQNFIEAPNPLPLNEWIHLAAVFTTSSGTTGTGSLYTNGVLAVSGTMNKPASVTRPNAYVGRSNNSADAFADVQIDNLRIWSVARTAQELTSDMRSTHPSGTAGLMAQYQFGDQGTGANLSEAPDSSGNGRTMTLVSTTLSPTPAVDVLARARFIETTAFVGQRLAPPQGEATSGANLPYLAGYINQAQGTAFSVTSYRDPFAVGFEEAARGAIIPINAGENNSALLEVWWYRPNKANLSRGFRTIYWPSIISRYSIQWPTAPPFAREIVLASNDGSGGLPSLEAKGSIYFQNDRTKPGFNPNEEHALMQGGQAYALRDDLNITSGPDYTSDPYVLLEYTGGDGRPSMSVFQVLREKGGDMFNYEVAAGTVLQPPMPLPLMEKPLGPKFIGSEPRSLNHEVFFRTVSESTVDGDLTTQEPHHFRPFFRELALQSPNLNTTKYYFVTDVNYAEKRLSGVVSDNRPRALTAPTQQPAITEQLTETAFVPFPPQYTYTVTVGVNVRHNAGSVADLGVNSTVYSIAPAMGSAWGLTVVAKDTTALTVDLRTSATTTLTSATQLTTSSPAFLTAKANLLAGLPSATDLQEATLLFVPSGTLTENQFQNWTLRAEPLSPVTGAPSGTFTLQDRKGNVWVYRGPHNAGDSPFMGMQFYYKTLPGFFFPNNKDGLILGVNNQPPVGTITPYLRSSDSGVFAGDPIFGTQNGVTDNNNALQITYRPVWPANPPVLQMAETLTVPKRGLPAVRGQTSLEIVYQQSAVSAPDNISVVLHDSTREKVFELGPPSGTAVLGRVPDSVKTESSRGKTWFPLLPPHLVQRFFLDPNRGAHGALVFKGEFVQEALGESYLQLNVLSAKDKTTLKNLCVVSDPARTRWVNAIDALETRMETFVENPQKPGTFIPNEGADQIDPDELAEVKNDDVAVDSYALTAVGPGSGFVTLIAGNGLAFTPRPDPVSVLVFRVEDALYPGELKIILPPNPLNELLTLQQVVDLAGKTADFEFEWKIGAPVDGLPPVLSRTSNDPGSQWLPLPAPKFADGIRAVLGESADVQALTDNYLIMRYRATGASFSDGSKTWSIWTEPALAEGWIKRVLAGINPFNQRVTDLFNNAVNTDVSILTQAGQRWEGDVALNQDSINSAGLIEIYETVLNRGKMLSIRNGINYGPANDALLLAAGYLNDLYMMVGNEAWADAANPTISIGTKDRTFGDIATALFAFKGQMASLLEEELALLRGRDDFLQPGVEIRPVYNRLFWNYTRGIDSGEVIYALNYNIQENNASGVNGVINADDARKMFPQGHGDAYGHYLTALKNYYSLILDNDFDWVPRIEAVNVLGKAVSVDFQDERKFATAAAALARAGRLVFDLTWRKDYKPGDGAGWKHFASTRANSRRLVATTRYWGLDHWATRTGQGAYLNWAMGNSILPDVDPDPAHEGIQKVDRTTVPELKELTALSDDLQTALDNAEGNLTPLGLPDGSLAFDLNPTQVTGPAAQTHFEQIYGRAKLALNNALAAFDDAKDVTRLLRSEQDSLADLQGVIANQELAYTNTLIEIYGTPYPDDIGPGKTYRQGFAGPDLIHYQYVDTPELVFPGLLDPAEERTFRIDVQSLPEARTLGLETEFNDIISPDNPAYQNGVHYVEFTLSPHGFFGKPEHWRSRRASPGRIQQAISDIIKARNAVLQALDDMDGQKEELDGAIRLFKEKVRTIDRIGELERDKYIAEFITQGVEVANELVQEVQEDVADKIEKLSEVLTESLPKSMIAGLAAGGDLTAPARGAAKAAAEGGASALEIAGNILKATTLFLRLANDQAAAGVDLFQIEPLNEAQEFRENVYELTLQFNAIQDGFVTLNARLQALDDAKRQLQAFVAEGDRIQAEREIFRQRSAALIQGFRTRDAAFRVFRNEKLERYKTMFDLAARYAFLAANAYDYETGLLHTPQGQAFINRIVNARALGVVRNGEPQFAGSNTGDPGLSSVLAEMKADFDVLKGRLGFNNPDGYATTVSLRLEKERIIPAADGDSAWQDVLEGARKANILEDADVRRYCMQVDRGNGLPVPGLVLEFGTTIEDGANLFGKLLASGDHYFDTSLFATKLFGVGVALEGYVGMDNPVANTSAVNAAGGSSPPDPNTSFLSSKALAATPGIYLIPVGVDFMRSPPLGDASQIRSWTVEDVAIPLPFNIGGSQLSTKALWQSNQSLTEQLFTVRKHQAFRPVSTTAVFKTDIFFGNTLRSSQFTNNRLIGRSVWNSKWKLVIPGHKLLGNPNEGLDRFVQTVKDIKLHFVTYSYAGN